MEIRPASVADALQIAEIYNYYIENSHATFEVEPIDADGMLHRMEDGWSGGYPFYVYEQNDLIVGYAFGRQHRPRAAYSHSIEVSVYIRPGCEGQNIGTLLYRRLLNEIANLNFHAVIAGIALPNEASVRLHEKVGFEKVAHFREVGRKFGRWIDVGYWELILAK